VSMCSRQGIEVQADERQETREHGKVEVKL
jgi:hypothetical protein